MTLPFGGLGFGNKLLNYEHAKGGETTLGTAYIGILGLIVSSIDLILTILTLLVSTRTKKAVVSNRTRQTNEKSMMEIKVCGKYGSISRRLVLQKIHYSTR